jgi:hypothetical protein
VSHSSDMRQTSRICPRRCQYTIRTLLVIITATAIVFGMYAWLGKDGLLVASLLVPAIAVFLLDLGPAKRKLRITVPATLFSFGVVWCLLFPKTSDVLRPDFVASVAIGIGAIAAGACLITLRRKPVWTSVMVIALFWSVLLNIVLLSIYYQTAKILMHELRLQQSAPSVSLPE